LRTELGPGHELDHLVGEHVLGMRARRASPSPRGWTLTMPDGISGHSGCESAEQAWERYCPAFSTRLVDAWRVVAAIAADTDPDTRSRFGSAMDASGWICGEADVCQRICRAALAAIDDGAVPAQPDARV